MWCPLHTPSWNSFMTFSISDSTKQTNKKPRGSFQNNWLSDIQYFITCNFSVLALDGDKSLGQFRVRRYNTMSLYQPDEANFSLILVGAIWSLNSSMSTHPSYSCRLFIPSALKFDSAKRLAKPYPFMSFIGLTSRSNSWILASHWLLFPSLSGCTNISFTELVGTYAITLECNT